MPSALRVSRDFARRAIANVRSAASNYERQLGEQGPEIKVEPFDAHNVSTSAALIKLGTSIAAARRHRANFEAAQQDVALAREKTRAEIARLRAEAAYNLGQGRQPVGRSTEITPYQSATLDLSRQRLDLSRRSTAERTRNRGRLAKAQAGLRQIDLAIERDTRNRATQAMATTVPVFNAVMSDDNDVRNRALTQLGINPDDYEDMSSPERARTLESARQRLHEQYLTKHRFYISRYFQPRRQKYQAVIDEGIADLGAEDTGAEEPLPVEAPDQGDPLDAFYGGQ
jgi:hypothetical protein